MIRSGFTLIELVVVIVILGILSSLASPNFSGLFTSAYRTQTQQQEGIFRTNFADAVNSYNIGFTRSCYQVDRYTNVFWVELTKQSNAVKIVKYEKTGTSCATLPSTFSTTLSPTDAQCADLLSGLSNLHPDDIGTGKKWLATAKSASTAFNVPVSGSSVPFSVSGSYCKFELSNGSYWFGYMVSGSVIPTNNVVS